MVLIPFHLPRWHCHSLRMSQRNVLSTAHNRWIYPLGAKRRSARRLGAVAFVNAAPVLCENQSRPTKNYSCRSSIRFLLDTCWQLLMCWKDAEENIEKKTGALDAKLCWWAILDGLKRKKTSFIALQTFQMHSENFKKTCVNVSYVMCNTNPKKDRDVTVTGAVGWKSSLLTMSVRKKWKWGQNSFFSTWTRECIDQWQGFAVLGSTVATSHEDPAWIMPRWLAEYDEAWIQVLAQQSDACPRIGRSPCGADETRLMPTGKLSTFGCCRSMLRGAATNPTRKGGGRAFGVKHPARWRGWRCSYKEGRVHNHPIQKKKRWGHAAAPPPMPNSQRYFGNCPQSGFNGRKQRYTIPPISNFGRDLQKLVFDGEKIHGKVIATATSEESVSYLRREIANLLEQPSQIVALNDKPQRNTTLINDVWTTPDQFPSFHHLRNQEPTETKTHGFSLSISFRKLKNRNENCKTCPVFVQAPGLLLHFFTNILWATDMEALWQTLMIEIESFYLKRIRSELSLNTHP